MRMAHGYQFAVFFAAIIPAMRATSSGSPLGFERKDCITLALMETKALASASREETAFAEISTICAWPDLS